MKNTFINVGILIIIILGLYFVLTQERIITGRILDVGNPRIQLEILGADSTNDSIMHDIKVTDRNTKKSILIKNTDPYHMIINNISYDNKYIVTNIGTSNIRSINVYNLDTGLEITSFCNYGDNKLVEHSIIYSDCTVDHRFDVRSAIVENGQYNPVIYKLNLDTLEKEVLLKSDDLHEYSFGETQKEEFNVFVTSVKNFNDWNDRSKWVESFTTVK